MATYNSFEEKRQAVDNSGTIVGTVSFPFLGWNYNGYDMETFNDEMTNELVGEEWGYLLEGADYQLIGCNTYDESILILITADAKELLVALDEFEKDVNK
jgi:hypothetical protein